jgi:radical SAM superfamily enzyme YgiQ (UPF0313 family)
MASLSEQFRKTRLDAETGTIRKPWQGHLHVAVVYPNQYAVAMASLGFLSIYRMLNAMGHVLCERAFLPDDRESVDAPIRTMESGRLLSEFDCIAFSISFENDYENILTILKKAGLPLPSASRGASLPLIMAGGVACFLNPEPLSLFFDCFLLGEAETLLDPFFTAFDPRRDRREMLLDLSRNIPGLYVPGFYADTYNNDDTLRSLTPIEDVPDKVRRAYTPDLEHWDTSSPVLTPENSFNDAFLVEVSRGCPHGCRFCSAGFVYRPYRHRSATRLIQNIEKGARLSGKIGLVGAAVSDLPELKALCAEGRKQDLQLGFSSLRADALDEETIGALKAGRLKTATIAPETGSQRMRQVINKGLDEATILTAAEKLVEGGIPNLKLYFMVGLPTETDEDVAAIVDLVKKIKDRFLRSSRVRGRMGNITVSLNSFVPKPVTPFQWVAMDEKDSLQTKIRKIKTGLKKTPNVRVHADMPRWVLIQGLLARGDRRVAAILRTVHKNNGNWPRTLKSSPINASFFLHRERLKEEIFPWDFIDHGIDRGFLWNEYQRALKGKTTRPCPMHPHQCTVCGVCQPSSKCTAS